MNAIEIIDRVRAEGAELVVEGDRLLVRGDRDRLPEDLRRSLSEHKAELMVALGQPLDRAVASILDSIRPHLSPALQRLPDDRLLALVNWNIITAWGAAVRKANER